VLSFPCTSCEESNGSALLEIRDLLRHSISASRGQRPRSADSTESVARNFSDVESVDRHNSLASNDESDEGQK
jgi:hypothetical protein